MKPVAKSLQTSTSIVCFFIFCKSPELLLDRPSDLVDFESVLSQLPRDSRHVGGLHAKMSALSLRKLVSASSYLGSRSAPMTTSLDASGRLRQTFLQLDLGPKLCSYASAPVLEE
jgi:hypothetical protein